MSKKQGRTVLIKIGDGGGTEVFEVLCGLRTKTMTINNSEYDVTTADCTTPGGALWTEVQNGIKRISVSGSGLIDDEDAEKRLNTVAMSATAIANAQVIIPGLGQFDAAFHFASVDYGGEQEGGATYGLSMNSTGAVTFTAET